LLVVDRHKLTVFYLKSIVMDSEQVDGPTYYKDSLDDILNCSSSCKRDLKCNALQNIMMHCICAKYFNPKIGLQTWLLKKVPVLEQAFSLAMPPWHTSSSWAPQVHPRPLSPLCFASHHLLQHLGCSWPPCRSQVQDWVS